MQPSREIENEVESMSMPPPPPPSPSAPPPQWQQPLAPQPAWQGAPTRVEKTTSPVAWLAVVGAAATAVGSCLTWATIEIAGETFAEFTGLGGDDVGGAKDGALTLPLGIIAAVLFLVGALVKNRVLHIVGAVAAGLAAAVAIYDISDIRSTFNDDSEGFSVSIGYGLWMTALGAAVATIAGIIAAVATRKRTVSA